jgi:acetamidase/formamidase
MGFAPTLDEALEQALEQMIQVLVYCGGLTPEEAYVLCSLAASFRITQVVNRPQKGVHGLFPLKMLPQGFPF